MSYIYFTNEEVAGLDKYLCELLDNAREYAGVPFVITSGLRSKEQNEAVGGVHDSAHLKGLAVDLACHSSDFRYKIVGALLQAGFSRIGIAKDHIHCDIDHTKPQNCLFIE